MSAGDWRLGLDLPNGADLTFVGPAHRHSVPRPSHVQAEVDEFVLDTWLHVEQLDTDIWWVRVGPFTAVVDKGRVGEWETTDEGTPE
jgi:hypothetical protein